MSKSKKKTVIPAQPQPSAPYGRVGDGGALAGYPPPVRSTDPKVQNTPSPGGPKYEGDAASQAAPSGTNPRRASKTSFVNTER